MVGATEEAEQLRRRMEEVRTQLHQDVQHIYLAARQLVDWRRIWRSSTWAITSLMVLAGYALVPRKVGRVTLGSPNIIKRLAGQERILVAKAKAEPQSNGLVGLIAAAMAGKILRRTLAFAKKRISQLIPAHRSTSESDL